MRILATAALTASAALAGRAGAQTDAPPPNVLLVVMDDVALWDFDRVELPVLDGLAARGVSFRRAYTMPTCSPTRQCLLFGEYTGTVAGYTCKLSEGRSPDVAKFSLAKLMKSRGYSTGLFGKWHMGAAAKGPWETTPNQHGFDTWRAGVPSNVTRCDGMNYTHWTRVDDGEITLSHEYQTRAVRDGLLDWWEATSGPKFAFVAFQAPHTPFHEPPADLLPEGYSVEQSGRGYFEAMLVSVDFVLGQMLQAIDPRSTFVFVLGDNGTPPEARAPGLRKNKVKQTAFENGVKVPFVVAGPGLSASFATEALVHAVDVLATIAELVGASVPEGGARDSVSLVPCLRDPAARVREHVFCDYEPFFALEDPTRGPPKRERAVIEERWKLRRMGKNVAELYDLEQDPEERRPLDPAQLEEGTEAAAAAQRLGELLGELERQRR